MHIFSEIPLRMIAVILFQIINFFNEIKFLYDTD